MKIDEAEEIIDRMYQNKMCSIEERTNEGLVIHLGTKIDFTKEEEASVIILRELQILRNKANKYDALVEKIKEKIEEIRKYEEIAREQIGVKIVIADSDSLNFGRKQAHGKDIEVLEELIPKEE